LLYQYYGFGKKENQRMQLIFRKNIVASASRLADRLKAHGPKSVVYLETGGALVGQIVAQVLDVPLLGLDIRYPLSRVARFPLNLLTFPFKEIVYRVTVPSIGTRRPIPTDGPVALVDDTAGTGRSLALAKDLLVASGVERSSIRTAVVRCGRRARRVVDFYEIESPMVFMVR
jgi:adenine/guanine phosphoribosyltransferase-like PRPP-binding protein